MLANSSTLGLVIRIYHGYRKKGGGGGGEGAGAWPWIGLPSVLTLHLITRNLTESRSPLCIASSSSAARTEKDLKLILEDDI